MLKETGVISRNFDVREILCTNADFKLGKVRQIVNVIITM